MPVPFQASGAVVPSKGGGWETSQVWPSCWRGAKSQWVSETVTEVCTGRDVTEVSTGGDVAVEEAGREVAGEVFTDAFESFPLHALMAATSTRQIRRHSLALVLTGCKTQPARQWFLDLVALKVAGTGIPLLRATSV